ncbi:MAG: serine/threonine protein kinase [bacterium]|nr:serine/threonine protein kinase [bacterium]
MTPEQWQRAKELLEEALDRAVDERTAFLDEACGDDREVRAAVEDMLKSGQPPTDFLQPPAQGAAVDLLVEGVLPVALGAQIGAYRLDDVISSGGMGTVYRAVRVDQQLEQQVAVKIIRRGMASPEVLRRFRREAQTLARLEHPHVARFLDAGATDDGLPYLVMEYVPGQALDRYCDERRLKVRERLALFRKVCAAVHYAHQNLIVHRDLKPGNVLVTDEGLPKLLDFGIAKLLDPEELAEFGDPTTTAARVMTPQYASPEQIRGEPTTTATDVYSLGVMLYELVTGHRPYEVKAKPRNELERLICEVEPATPSSAISRIIEIAQPDGTTRRITPDTVANQRDDRPDRLRRRLTGDVDTIIMTALHKDPNRRYTSAEQLSEDLRRHLEGLPVQARPDTWSYRTAKFIRRNKVTVGAALLVFLSLAAGVVGTSIGLARAQRARADAEAARTQAVADARKAKWISEFLQDLLAAAEPYNEGVSTPIGTVLEIASVQLRSGLDEQPDVEAALHFTIGNAYLILAEYERSNQHLQESLQLGRRALGDGDFLVAENLDALGRLATELGRYAEAEEQYGASLAIYEKSRVEAGAEFAATLTNYANLLTRLGDLEKAEAVARKAIDTYTRLEGDDAPGLRHPLATRAKIAYARGKYDDAVAAYRDLLHRCLSQYGPRHPAVAGASSNLAVALQSAGHLEEARSLLRQALNVDRELLGGDHPHVAIRINNLANVVLAAGDHEQAEQLFREALALQTAVYDTDHPAVMTTRGNLAQTLSRSGRHGDAEPIIRQVLESRRRTLGQEHPDVAVSLSNLAGSLLQQRKYDAAAPIAHEALAIRRRVLGDSHPDVATSIMIVGGILRETGEYSQAEEFFREARQAFIASIGPRHVQVAIATANIAGALAAQGHFEEAIAQCREAVALERDLLGSNHPTTMVDIKRLAGLLQHVSEFDEADPLFREALGYERQRHTEPHQATAAMAYRVGKVRLERGDPPGAEPFLRECLDVASATVPDAHRLMMNGRDALGECLLALGRYEESERLFRANHLILTQLIPPNAAATRRTRQRLIDLYEAWGKPEEAAKWRAKLPDDDEAATSQPGRDDAATSQPAAGQAAAGTPDPQPVATSAPAPRHTATNQPVSAPE